MDDVTALAERMLGTFPGRSFRRFLRMDGIDRCLVLSSQAFTALIPLLIVVAAVAPPGGADVVARTIITKFGLTGASADSVEQLFATEGGVSAGALGAGSVLLLLYSGVSFTRRLMRMYRAAWDREKAGVRGNVFAVVALLVLLVEVLAVYAIMSRIHTLPADWLLALPLAILIGLVPWTSIPYLLMDRAVHWRRLLGTGILTAVAMAVYGTSTTFYMPETIERYTADFGLFGVTIAIIGWLLGAAGIVVAGAAIGAELDESRASWALRLKQRLRLYDPAEPQPASLPADDRTSLTGADLLLIGRVAVTWMVMAGAVWAATAVVPGIEVHGGVLTYFVLSLLLGLVNALIGPTLRLVVADVTWPRLGVVALVVNGVMLEVTSWLSLNLATDSLVSSTLGALVISVAIALYEFALRPFHPHGMSRELRTGAEGGGKP
jgi:membrane protein